ncbi:hypothetical protein MLD59_02495 [Verrucomicrobiaceae bacterium E54]|nr:hypothetical protein [Verrucomicrobiaceae bacterium E54]
MHAIRLISILFLCLTAGVCGGEVPGRHLFVLSGQSNMTQTLGHSFYECVGAVLGKDRVLIARTGHPGQPIKNWYRDWQPPEGMEDPKPDKNGHLYDVLIAAVERVRKDETPASATFIWMQGEADASRGWASVYEKSFLGLSDQLRADLGIEEIHFVVGRINDYWLREPDGEAMREILAKLGEDHANGAWIDTDDLNRGVNPWGGFSFEDGHYPPEGYVVIGQRFAREACRLIAPDIELDPAIFEERFIDSYRQIKTHDGIGKKVSGSAPPGATDLSVLSDGKFGTTDHQDGAWVGFPPSDQPIELVLDLGAEMEVDSMAVNLLLSSAAKSEFPEQLVYSTSADGQEFRVNGSRYNTIRYYNTKELAKMRTDGIEPVSVLLLTRQWDREGPVRARKVKVEIKTGGQWVFIDEIVVNPRK